MSGNKQSGINQTTGELISDMANESKELSTRTNLTYRHPLMVVFLATVTCGIYGLIWLIKTSREMNKMGANIPILLIIAPFIIATILILTIIMRIHHPLLAAIAALLIFPIILYFYWRYSKGIAFVTGRRSPLEYFLLILLIPLIGMPIIQHDLNKSWYKY